MIDINRSLWASRAEPREALASLQGDIRADVVIIGGGFTGLSTAYHVLRRCPDLAVVVLEARRIANGGSGRNGGLMLNWVNGVEPGDPERAKGIYAATREGIDGIAAIIAEHGLKVRWRREGSLHVQTRVQGAEAAQAEVEGYAKVGVPLEYWGPERLSEQLRLKGAVGAVFDPTAGHLDGVSFLEALLPVVRGLGARVFEDSEVVQVELGKEVMVRTGAGSVRAPRLVLATNAYTPKLGFFGDRMIALHAHVVATERRADWGERGFSASGFDDDLDRISYGCLTTDGEVVFGGGVNAAYGYSYGGVPSFDGAADFAGLEGHLRRYLPGTEGVSIAQRWTGPVALTWNRICAMGVTGEHRNVFYGLGYSGHGVTLANLAGRVLTDVMTDADERWRGLPFYQGDMAWMPPEPFRWVGYHLMTRLTGKSPRKRGVR